MSKTKTPLHTILVISALLGLPYSLAMADDSGENEWLLPSPTITATSTEPSSHVVPVMPAIQAPVPINTDSPLTQPTPTVVADIPVRTTSERYDNPKPAVTALPKAEVVELSPTYVTKTKALDYLKDKRYKLVASYAVTGGKPAAMTNFSHVLYYYVNPQSHMIGVAVSKEAAKHLTFANDDVYSARKAENLSDTLARWARDAGYELKWLSEYNYKLQYSYEFVGSLLASDGPLNQILQSIAGDNYALKAEVTANRVILIKDNEYSPSVLGL